jgi:hypothetical protein
MQKANKTINPNAKKRQELLFQAYLRMVESKGREALLFPKSYFYERLADETGYSSTTVEIYIGRALKKQ